MNNRPRKCINYKTAREVLFEWFTSSVALVLTNYRSKNLTFFDTKKGAVLHETQPPVCDLTKIELIVWSSSF